MRKKSMHRDRSKHGSTEIINYDHRGRFFVIGHSHMLKMYNFLKIFFTMLPELYMNIVFPNIYSVLI